MPIDINHGYYIQPVLYGKFQCIGDKCPVNCCFQWGVIGWTEKEYEKLKNADMSDSLRANIETAFIPAEDSKVKRRFQYIINYAEGNKCPMLTESGLCSIQKEIGEEYLSHTCKVYPRTSHICGNAIIRTCNLSCFHVMQMLCSDEDSMKIEAVQIDVKDRGTFSIDTPYTKQDMKKYPALEYELDIFNFFYSLLSDKSRSIETSVVLGAMAAKKIDEFIGKGQVDKISAIIKALEPQLNDPVQIHKLENVRPNLTLKANFSAGLLKMMKNIDVYKNVFEGEKPSEEKWNEGTEQWNAAFKDKPFVMRNIALDLYFSNKMPFKEKSLSLFDNFRYYVAELSAVKFLAAAMTGHYGKNIEETFNVSVSFIDRSFSHGMNNIEAIIGYMDAFGCTAPAHLLGIIK